MTETRTIPRLPAPLPDDAHKGLAGRLLCLCGSVGLPGAATLTVRAAHRSGAGLVTLVVFQPEVVACVAPASPETVYLDVSRSQDLYAGRIPREIAEHHHDVRVVGPGLSRSGRTRELVRRLVESGFEGPTLLDADALTVLAGAPELLNQARGPVVLTPHPGEARSLLERDIPSDPEGRAEAALELARCSGSIVVLKGKGSIVTDGQRLYRCERGNPGMGQRRDRRRAGGDRRSDRLRFGARLRPLRCHGGGGGGPRTGWRSGSRYLGAAGR